MDNTDGVTITTILKTWQTLNNGEYPVVVRVTHNRKTRYIATGESSTKGRWLPEQNEVYGKPKSKKQIQKVFAEIRNNVQRCVEIQGCFTFEKFFILQKKKKAVTKSFVDFWDEHVKYLRKVKRGGTADSYNDARKKFIEFSGKKRYTLDQITKPLLEEFRDFMLQKQKSGGVGIYLRSLKAVYGVAMDKDLVKPEKDPRKNIRLKIEKTPKKALSREQLEAIRDFDLSSKPHFVESRMMFMFSYYTQGMNFKDMCQLNLDEHLFPDKIVYNRGKTTEDHFVIKIRPAVREILDYVENLRKLAIKQKQILNPRSKKLVFRVYDKLTEVQYDNRDKRKATRNQRAKLMTQHIRKIAKELNQQIEKENEKREEKLPLLFTPIEMKLLTFYSARHTYATMLKKSNAPVSLISEALGHSDMRTTENYLDSFGNDELDKFNDLIM